MKDLKFMSLGGNCEDIAYLGDQRVHGPVDNMRAMKGPLSAVKLLKDCDSVYNELIGNNFTMEGTLKKFDTYGIRHNDNSTEKFKNELRKRMDTLMDFYEHIMDEDKYFVYSLNPYDVVEDPNYPDAHLTKNFLNGVEELKQLGIFNKIIFVGSILESSFKKERWFHFNSDEVYNIPNIKYITIKNIGLLSDDLKNYSHKQFLREISKIL